MVVRWLKITENKQEKHLLKKLGTDGSTTTVGYVFVDGKEIVTMGFIPIQKKKRFEIKLN